VNTSQHSDYTKNFYSRRHCSKVFTSQRALETSYSAIQRLRPLLTMHVHSTADAAAVAGAFSHQTANSGNLCHSWGVCVASALTTHATPHRNIHDHDARNRDSSLQWASARFEFRRKYALDRDVLGRRGVSRASGAC